MANGGLEIVDSGSLLQRGTVAAKLHQRLSVVCSACVDSAYELILVNDGSRDSIWKIMKEISDADEHVVAINLSRNYGHQPALSAGLKMCRGERVLVLDADLQDPPINILS